MIELVIARYKEDLDWVQQIASVDLVTVYNKHFKFNNLPNLGRESDTYLHHIISRYDSLSEYTIFSQGDPLFHEHQFIEKINDLDNLIQSTQKTGIYFFSLEDTEPVTGVKRKEHPNGLPVYYFLDLLFGIELQSTIDIKYNCAALFIVHRDNIVSRPKEFYQFLRCFVSNSKNPIEGFVFERLWKYIFNPKIPLSLKYISLKKYDQKIRMG